MKKNTFPVHHFEKVAWTAGKLVCGLDEVGRGCLAGPLVVSAVVLPPHTGYRLLRDSKILTKQEREKAYRWITASAWHATSILSPSAIDRHNIYQATLIAMRRAYLNLCTIMAEQSNQIQSVVVDAMPLTLPSCPQYQHLAIHSFPFGERFSKSIAAASIVAKVTRDRLMGRLDGSFAHYALEEHKGYATQKHRTVLAQRGPSIIHRTSFLSKIELLSNTIEQPFEQTSLFDEILAP